MEKVVLPWAGVISGREVIKAIFQPNSDLHIFGLKKSILCKYDR